MTPQLAVAAAGEMASAAAEAQRFVEDDDDGKHGNGAGSFLETMLARQKRRRVLLISMDTAVSDFANYDIRDLELNAIKLNFDFVTSDYLFFGGGLFWRYAGRNSESFYGAFVNGGANVTLFRNLRPYLQLEAFANTGAEVGLGAALGLDVTTTGAMTSTGLLEARTEPMRPSGLGSASPGRAAFRRRGGCLMGGVCDKMRRLGQFLFGGEPA